MRIGFVLNNLSGGGAERVAVTVANSLSGCGHDVTLILNQLRGAYLSDVSANVRITALGKRMLFALPSLFRKLRDGKFDAVLTVLDQPSIACLLLKPLLAGTAVIVVECNNPLAESAGASNYVWRLVRALRPWLYPAADHIITKSEGIRSILMQHFRCQPTQVTAIPNPVDVSRIGELAAASVDHKWLPGTRDAPVISAMGRLVHQKGFDTLLRAFSILRARRQARLVVLGEGKERPGLEALAAELGVAKDVNFVGFVANPYAYIARSDCFALSSRWEGWPNALVEALACGIPVVSTKCETGPADIINSTDIGYLTDVDDPEGLASAIETAIDTEWDKEILLARLRELSPPTIANRYLAVIKKASPL